MKATVTEDKSKPSDQSGLNENQLHSYPVQISQSHHFFHGRLLVIYLGQCDYDR